MVRWCSHDLSKAIAHPAHRKSKRRATPCSALAGLTAMCEGFYRTIFHLPTRPLETSDPTDYHTSRPTIIRLEPHLERWLIHRIKRRNLTVLKIPLKSHKNCDDRRRTARCCPARKTRQNPCQARAAVIQCAPSMGDSLIGRTVDSGSISPGSNPGPPA